LLSTATCISRSACHGVDGALIEGAALIDAKLKGEGIDAEADVPAATSNVVDLMAALKKSPRPIAGGSSTEAQAGRATRR
jgi:non-homologous end joining protein Ku